MSAADIGFLLGMGEKQMAASGISSGYANDALLTQSEMHDGAHFLGPTRGAHPPPPLPTQRSISQKRLQFRHYGGGGSKVAALLGGHRSRHELNRYYSFYSLVMQGFGTLTNFALIRSVLTRYTVHDATGSRIILRCRGFMLVIAKRGHKEGGAMSKERKAHSPEQEGFGPSSQAMLDLASTRIQRLMDDPVTNERARNSMWAVLTGDAPDRAPEAPNFTKAELDQGKVFGGYFALVSMKISLRECEYYFRRYPFKGLPISRADHFRNVCEMYFDRVVQFRDRAKALMNAIKATPGGENIAIKQILKAFDKAFDWEIRNRNAVHHHGRFEYDAIEKMAIAHLLRHHSGIHAFVQPDRVYREEQRKWVARVRQRALILDQLVEIIAKFTLDNCDFASVLKENVKTNGSPATPLGELPYAIEEAVAEAP